MAQVSNRPRPLGADDGAPYTSYGGYPASDDSEGGVSVTQNRHPFPRWLGSRPTLDWPNLSFISDEKYIDAALPSHRLGFSHLEFRFVDVGFMGFRCRYLWFDRIRSVGMVRGLPPLIKWCRPLTAVCAGR